MVQEKTEIPVQKGYEMGTTDVLKPWFVRYVETNRDFPMAPAATDTAIGGAMVESLMLGQCTILDIAQSQFTDNQINALSRVVAKAHSDYGVKMVPENVPVEDAKTFPVERFQAGWSDIKKRVFMAMSGYVGSLDIDLKPDEDVVSEKNIAMLHQFFTLPQYQKAVDALCNMYAAANTVFDKDENQLRGDEQKMMYAGERASGFRVTTPLIELIEDIDTAVTNEWKKRHSKDVPETAKNVFVDIITRRKDQPLN